VLPGSAYIVGGGGGATVVVDQSGNPLVIGGMDEAGPRGLRLAGWSSRAMSNRYGLPPTNAPDRGARTAE
jgi:hypothetical protein